MEEIKLTKDNVYYTSYKLKAGEIIHFALELLDKDNISKWNHYKNDMYHFTLSNRGLCVVLPLLCKNPSIYDKSLEEVTGFTEEEYKKYMQDLYDKKLYDEDKSKALYHVSGG